MKKNTVQNLKILSFIKILHTSLLFGVFLMVYQPIRAQIPAPDLYCIRNDTLQWSVPTVNCGNILGYEIYYSDAKSGPYSLLTTINNVSVNSYFHITAGKDFYYYMLTKADCPGQLPLSSDTLDNTDPPLVPIEVVNVVNGKCVITWKIPATTKQLSYIIYRTTPNGTLPIDTVSNTNTYTDLTSNPLVQSESYFILALDLCGNASIFDKPHYSILADTSFDYCKRELRISWTKYQNWANGVEAYQIWASTNGANAIMVGTTDAATTDFTLKNIAKGDKLCIYIKALQAGSNLTTQSNEICIDINAIRPVEFIQPISASVLSNNSVELKWAWSADADLQSASVLSGNSITNITSNTGYVYNAPAVQVNEFTVTGINPVHAPVFFKVSATDFCGAIYASFPVSTIHMTGKANEDKSNTLVWDFLAPAGIIVKNYTVLKNIAGNETVEGVLPANVNTLKDEVDIDKQEEAEICYYVVANVEITLEDGTVLEEKIRSNDICLQQFASLFFPNAIAPDGLNNEFRPLTVFAQNATYTLQVYDRFGQKVFETNDINQPWKGKKDGVALPLGVYVYYARLLQPNGKTEERKGSVLLLR